MNEENLSAFLEALNLSEEQRSILSSEEANADASKELATTYLQSVTENAKKLLSNDSEFRKTFYDNGYKEAEGKFRGSYRNAFKSEFGFSAEEVEGKSERELIQLVKTKFDNGQPDNKEWQKKLASLQEQYDTEKATWQSSLEAAKNESQSFIERFKAEQKLNAYLPENLIIGKDAALTILKERLSQRSLNFGDTQDGFKITKPDGTYLQNGNTLVEHPKDVVAMLIPDLLRQSNADPTNTGNGKQPIEGKVEPKKPLNPRLEKARQNAEMQQKGYM